MSSHVSYILASTPGYVDLMQTNVIDVDIYGTFDKVGSSPVWNIMPKDTGRFSKIWCCPCCS